MQASASCCWREESSCVQDVGAWRDVRQSGGAAVGQEGSSVAGEAMEIMQVAGISWMLHRIMYPPRISMASLSLLCASSFQACSSLTRVLICMVEEGSRCKRV